MFCLPSRLPRKTEDERERIKQQMAEAVARYDGPTDPQVGNPLPAMLRHGRPS